MLEAAIIGRWRSTPGLFSMRRRIRLLLRFNRRWTLAFTRKPPGGRTVEGVKYLDCSPKPGGFRVSRPRSASDYAWFRISAGYIRGRPLGNQENSEAENREDDHNDEEKVSCNLVVIPHTKPPPRAVSGLIEMAGIDYSRFLPHVLRY